MEFGDWEYLSENNLFSSQIIEDNSNFVHEEDQQVVAGQVALIPNTEHDQGDVSVKEIREMTEECDAVPQVQLENTMNDEIEESKEVKFEEKDVLKEENLETEISRSFEFVEEEEEELEEVKEVIGGMEPSSGIDCVNGSDQRNSRGRLRGIGALSSVGIAAATLSMLILGGCKRSQSRELQMQIYADDKRMAQPATKLSQALPAVGGTPAKVSFGGCYQGLQLPSFQLIEKVSVVDIRQVYCDPRKKLLLSVN